MDLSNIEYVSLQGEQNGDPVTYRCIKEPKYLENLCPHLISIVWPYDSIGKGLASEDDNTLQNCFEDALDCLEAEEQGILSLVVFGNNRKEWHWYVKDIENWMDRFNEILSTHNQYPLQIKHTENDQWKYHNAFTNWANLA